MNANARRGKTPASDPGDDLAEFMEGAVDDAVFKALLLRRVRDMERKVDSLTRDRDNALRWGVLVLGAALVSLGLWVFSFVPISFGGHVK